jgi:type II secretory pathway component PulF
MKLYHAKYAQPLPGGSVAVHEEDFYLPDATAVRRTLRQRGLWPIHIYEQKQALLEWLDVRSRDWQLQLLRALRFQSATASTGTALLNIIEAETDPRKRLAFLPTRTVLKGGGSFSEALRELKLMDAATIAIITAGERAGDLKGVVQHAIQHVEEKGSQYKAVMAAMGWLAFDIFSVISSLWGAQFGFIPYLKSNKSPNATPEQLEKFENAINMVSWVNLSLIFITTALIVAILVIGGSYWANRHKPDHWSARMVIKMPLFGEYLSHTAMKDTCKLIARLLKGKVPLDDALRIIIETTIEPSAKSYWTSCKQRIMAGVEPAKALARWPLTRAERNQIATVQSVDQLTEVYESLAGERALMAKSMQRKIVLTGIVIMVVLSGIIVLTMIWLLMIQNQGFMDSLSGMRGG